MQYLSNPKLKTIRTDWQGNPYKDKQFQYLDNPFYPSFKNLFKWQMQGNPQKAEKKADKWRPLIHQEQAYLQKKNDFIVWLGHATFLIQLNGIRMITDPVLYNLPFLPRFVKLPFDISALKDIDYILLSHDHRDHCDKKSIRQLLNYNQPKKILAAMRLNNVISNWVGETPIEEAAWYQVFETEGVEITYMPTRHWSRRALHDFNRVLWGAFMIKANGKTIYFGSDSGYGAHYTETASYFQNIDVAILGIGAYKPAMMMQEIHKSPSEAMQAFRDLKAGKMIPMHYGTYDLSDEPISEPYHQVKSCFEQEGIADQLLRLDVNQPYFL